jgi:hypothetical protein
MYCICPMWKCLCTGCILDTRKLWPDSQLRLAWGQAQALDPPKPSRWLGLAWPAWRLGPKPLHHYTVLAISSKGYWGILSVVHQNLFAQAIEDLKIDGSHISRLSICIKIEVATRGVRSSDCSHPIKPHKFDIWKVPESGIASAVNSQINFSHSACGATSHTFCLQH